MCITIDQARCVTVSPSLTMQPETLVLYKSVDNILRSALLKMGYYCSTTVCYYWDMSVK